MGVWGEFFRCLWIPRHPTSRPLSHDLITISAKTSVLTVACAATFMLSACCLLPALSYEEVGFDTDCEAFEYAAVGSKAVRSEAAGCEALWCEA